MIKLWDQFGMKQATFQRWAEYLYYQSDLFDDILHADLHAAISSGILPSEKVILGEAFEHLLSNPQSDPTGILTRSVRIFSESPPAIRPQESIPTDVDALVSELKLPEDVDKPVPIEIPFNVLGKSVLTSMDEGTGPDKWDEIVRIAKLYPDTNLYIWPPQGLPLKVEGSIPDGMAWSAERFVVFDTRGKQEVELLSHVAHYLETNDNSATPIDLSWAQATTYRNFNLDDANDIDELVRMVRRSTQHIKPGSLAGFIDFQSRTLIIATSPRTFHSKIYDSFASSPPHLAEIWTGLDENELILNIARTNSGYGANLGNPDVFKALAKSLTGWRGIERRAKLVKVNGDRIAIEIPIQTVPGSKAEFQLGSMETSFPVDPDPQSSLARELTLTLPNMLHLRPAGKIQEIVKNHPDTEVTIHWKDKTANAASTTDMSMLGIPQTEVKFIAYGKHKDKVLGEIEALIGEANPNLWGTPSVEANTTTTSASDLKTSSPVWDHFRFFKNDFIDWTDRLAKIAVERDYIDFNEEDRRSLLDSIEGRGNISPDNIIRIIEDLLSEMDGTAILIDDLERMHLNFRHTDLQDIPEEERDKTVRGSFVVSMEGGLHKRPLVKLSNIIRSFPAHNLFYISHSELAHYFYNPDSFDPKIIANGKPLQFAIRGPDAEKAIKKLAEFFNSADPQIKSFPPGTLMSEVFGESTGILASMPEDEDTIDKAEFLWLDADDSELLPYLVDHLKATAASNAHERSMDLVSAAYYDPEKRQFIIPSDVNEVHTGIYMAARKKWSGKGDGDPSEGEPLLVPVIVKLDSEMNSLTITFHRKAGVIHSKPYSKIDWERLLPQLIGEIPILRSNSKFIYATDSLLSFKLRQNTGPKDGGVKTRIKFNDDEAANRATAQEVAALVSTKSIEDGEPIDKPEFLWLDADKPEFLPYLVDHLKAAVTSNGRTRSFDLASAAYYDPENRQFIISSDPDEVHTGIYRAAKKTWSGKGDRDPSEGEPLLVPVIIELDSEMNSLTIRFYRKHEYANTKSYSRSSWEKLLPQLIEEIPILRNNSKSIYADPGRLIFELGKAPRAEDDGANVQIEFSDDEVFNRDTAKEITALIPSKPITRTITSKLQNGLHTRPKHRLISIASNYPDTNISIITERGTRAINGTTMRLFSVAYGEKLTLSVTGPKIQAEEILDDIENVFGNNKSTITKEIINQQPFSSTLFAKLIKFAKTYADTKLLIGLDEDHMVEVGPSIIQLMLLDIKKGDEIILQVTGEKGTANELLTNALATLGVRADGETASGGQNASSLESSAGFSGFFDAEAELVDAQTLGAQHMLGNNESDSCSTIDPTSLPDGSGHYFFTPGAIPMQSVAPTPATR
jgi:phosphotransferase system HPr-like phosphotransfer protein